MMSFIPANNGFSLISGMGQSSLFPGMAPLQAATSGLQLLPQGAEFAAMLQDLLMAQGKPLPTMVPALDQTSVKELIVQIQQVLDSMNLGLKAIPQKNPHSPIAVFRIVSQPSEMPLVENGRVSHEVFPVEPKHQGRLELSDPVWLLVYPNQNQEIPAAEEMEQEGEPFLVLVHPIQMGEDSKTPVQVGVEVLIPSQEQNAPSINIQLPKEIIQTLTGSKIQRQSIQPSALAVGPTIRKFEPSIDTPETNLLSAGVPEMVLESLSEESQSQVTKSGFEILPEEGTLAFSPRLDPQVKDGLGVEMVTEIQKDQPNHPALIPKDMALSEFSPSVVETVKANLQKPVGHKETIQEKKNPEPALATPGVMKNNPSLNAASQVTLDIRVKLGDVKTLLQDLGAKITAVQESSIAVPGMKGSVNPVESHAELLNQELPVPKIQNKPLHTAAVSMETQSTNIENEGNPEIHLLRQSTVNFTTTEPANIKVDGTSSLGKSQVVIPGGSMMASIGQGLLSPDSFPQIHRRMKSMVASTGQDSGSEVPSLDKGMIFSTSVAEPVVSVMRFQVSLPVNMELPVGKVQSLLVHPSETTIPNQVITNPQTQPVTDKVISALATEPIHPGSVQSGTVSEAIHPIDGTHVKINDPAKSNTVQASTVPSWRPILEATPPVVISTANDNPSISFKEVVSDPAALTRIVPTTGDGKDLHKVQSIDLSTLPLLQKNPNQLKPVFQSQHENEAWIQTQGEGRRSVSGISQTFYQTQVVMTQDSLVIRMVPDAEPYEPAMVQNPLTALTPKAGQEKPLGGFSPMSVDSSFITALKISNQARITDQANPLTTFEVKPVQGETPLYSTETRRVNVLPEGSQPVMSKPEQPAIMEALNLPQTEGHRLVETVLQGPRVIPQEQIQQIIEAVSPTPQGTSQPAVKNTPEVVDQVSTSNQMGKIELKSPVSLETKPPLQESPIITESRELKTPQTLPDPQFRPENYSRPPVVSIPFENKVSKPITEVLPSLPTGLVSKLGMPSDNLTEGEALEGLPPEKQALVKTFLSSDLLVGRQDQRREAIRTTAWNPDEKATLVENSEKPIDESPVEESNPLNSNSRQTSDVIPPQTVSASRPTSSRSEQITQVMEQVVQGVKSHQQQGSSEIRVRLFPENLGELHIRMRLENGQLVAEIRAERSQTSELLSNNSRQLQGLLMDSGIRVDQVIVRTGSMGSGGGDQNPQPQRERSPFQNDGQNQNGFQDKKGSPGEQKDQSPSHRQQPAWWERYA